MTPVELPHGVRRDRIEPLWSRVDGNRVRFALFIAAYLISIAVSAAVAAAVVGLLLIPLFLQDALTAAAFIARVRLVAGVAAAIALVAGSGWVAYAMLSAERRLLKRLGAERTPTGSYRPTKLALKDMALAAGFDHAPALWIVPGCNRINAFAVGRTRRTAVVGITEGFADRLDVADQRAVFANLMARLTNDDVRWATAVSALVGPLWRMRDADLKRDPDFLIPEDGEDRERRAGEARSGGGYLLYFVLYALVIVITEVLMAGHQRQTMLTAEKADAEGMLLLKDPHEMLHALETVLEADNTVPSAGESLSGLFYCWAGFGYAPEDDPEFARLARLREVLGAEGLTVRPAYIVPPNADELVEVPAPRIEPTRAFERAAGPATAPIDTEVPRVDTEEL